MCSHKGLQQKKKHCPWGWHTEDRILAASASVYVPNAHDSYKKKIITVTFLKKENNLQNICVV